MERVILWIGGYVYFVVDCEAEKELLLSVNHKAKVIVIENGVDTDYFKDNIKDKCYDFVSLGRLKDHKRVDLLVDATRIYIDKTNRKDVKVAILGDGPEMNNLLNLIDKNNLSKNVKMYGYVEKYTDIADVLLSSKVGVLTTVAGGSGNVTINELFAAGLPVLAIGSEEGIDLSYIDNDVNGYMTSSISSNELADLMIKIISNKQKLKEMSKHLYLNKDSLDWKNKLKSHPSLEI